VRRRHALRGALALCAAAVAAPGGDLRADGSGARLVVDPPSFDFGSALAGRALHKEFVLRNIGGAPLVIDKVSTTCGCTVASGYDTRLAPGGRTVLRVTFTTPPRPLGRTEKSVLVKSNDAAQPILEIKVAATVVAPPSPRPR